MDNWTEIQTEINESYSSFDIAYKELVELISQVNAADLFKYMAADFYISLLGKNRIFEPSEAEYLAGICVSLKHYSDCELVKSKIDSIHTKIKDLATQQSHINACGSFREDDNEEDTYLKLFVGTLKNDYSFTRGYSWYRTIEENNIKALFANYNDKAEKIFGFYPEEVYKIVDAYTSLIHARVKECILENSSIETPEELFNYIIMNKLDLMSIGKDELFESCNDLDEQHFEAILKFFGSRVESEGREEQIKFFTDDNYFSSHPIFIDGNNIVIINHQLLLWNLRSCIEEELKKDNKIWNDYDKKHKAKFLEDKSAELIQSMLSQCDIHTSLYYKPAESDTACELDVLALYDQIVVLVEAKSGIYSKPARRGGIKRLETVVQKNIECAYTQGERTRKYILENDEAVFYYDADLQKKAVTLHSKDIVDIFIINTTMDFYAELGVDLYKLKKLGLYKSDEFPWTVCISDLEVIRDFIDFPNQFLYYMYFRRAINNSSFAEESGAVLLYELDLLAMYKTENTKEFEEYDILSEKEKHEMLQEGYLITSKDYTNYFKTYYDECFFNKKPSITPKKYNPRFLEMVRQLEEYNTKGISVFVLRMLDIDLDNQNWLMEQIDMICKKSIMDNQMHVLTIKVMPQRFFETHFGMVIYSGFEKDRKKIEQLAFAAGAIQQGMTGTSDWITLCIYHDDDRHFINQFYFYSGSKEIEEKMRAITNHIPVTAPIKVYPNEPCPCGSGKKYKKCCGK